MIYLKITAFVVATIIVVIIGIKNIRSELS